MAIKKSLRFTSLLALLLLPGLGNSQVQLVEQEMSAIIPQVGFLWNKNISSFMGGVEYVVEGRTALGIRVSQPLADTILLNPALPALKSRIINPYAVFEFIEPGTLSIFTFSMHAGFTWVEASGEGADLSSFERTIYSLGPQFGFRMQANPHFTYIPTVGYDFQFTKWERNIWVEAADFQEDTDIWHDVTAGVFLIININEFHSTSLKPYLSVRFGTGREADDLINVGMNLAHAWKF